VTPLFWNVLSRFPSRVQVLGREIEVEDRSISFGAFVHSPSPPHISQKNDRELYGTYNHFLSHQTTITETHTKLENITTVSRSIVSDFFRGKYPKQRGKYPFVVLLVAVVEFDGRR
jgi:hypothetical protein